mmetsp:Transcript_14825/g.22083  ORF Transcript_14825/g.22083 Transcript_14825/m.22083 type:complete len:195 (-) Transcript_14825:515-1099(-)
MKPVRALSFVLLSTECLLSIEAFAPIGISHENRPTRWSGSTVRPNTRMYGEGSIDVSDLGITMDDMNAPLPDDMFQIASSGCESTSRIPSVDDEGCVWEETNDTMDVKLSIPGLRGQPPAALTLDITKNTATITAFGYAVWSCILRGECVPESLSFSATDGNDMVPYIEISLRKANPGDRWGGFIAQIGEDSIL